MRRRKRTVIFTASSQWQVPEVADDVYDVSASGVVTRTTGFKRAAMDVIAQDTVREWNRQGASEEGGEGRRRRPLVQIVADESSASAPAAPPETVTSELLQIVPAADSTQEEEGEEGGSDKIDEVRTVADESASVPVLETATTEQPVVGVDDATTASTDLTAEDLKYAQETLIAACTGTIDSTMATVRKALGSGNEKMLLPERLFDTLPFNFVHNVVTAIIEATGFGADLLDESQKNHRHLKSAPARQEYVDKLKALTWMTLELGSVNEIDTSTLWVKKLTPEQAAEVRRLIEYFAVAAVSVPSSRAAECIRAMAEGINLNAEEEEMPSGEDAEAAASKLQARMRGKAARQEVADMKASKEAAAAEAPAPAAAEEEPDLPTTYSEVMERLIATVNALGIKKPDPNRFPKYFKERVPARAFVDIFSAVQSTTDFGAGLFDDRPELLDVKGKSTAKDKEKNQKGNDKRELFTRISVCADVFLQRPTGTWDIGLIEVSGKSGASPEGVLHTLQLLLAVALAGTQHQDGAREAMVERNTHAVTWAVER